MAKRLGSVGIRQGTKANYNGKSLEKQIQKMIQEQGYPVFWNNKKPQQMPFKYLLREVPFTNIYGGKSKTEFVLHSKQRAIRIEAKYQAAAGSVDEKLVYTLLNAIQCYPEKEIILLLEGQGFRKGAREWILKMLDSNWLNYRNKKTIHCFTLKQFQNWFQKEITANKL